MGSAGDTFEILKGLALIPVKYSDGGSIINEVQRMEKKAFPKIEALAFEAELRKNNTQLYCAISLAPDSKVGEKAVIGYLAIARVKRNVFLNKICVAPQYQQKGVGRWMMENLVEVLKSQGCASVHLWVDEGREPARRLYASSGFVQSGRVENYYAPGRTGLSMTLNLSQ